MLEQRGTPLFLLTARCIFEAYVSGDITTIPPHISFEEAKNYASALLKGDPDEGGIIKESIKSVFEGIIPHKHE